MEEVVVHKGKINATIDFRYGEVGKLQLNL
jgi:hypothetical protein